MATEAEELIELQELEELEQLEKLSAQEQTTGLGEQAAELGLAALNRTIGILDLPGAALRAGVAGAIDPFVEADLITGEEVLGGLKAAIPGTGDPKLVPGFNEILKRAGVPEGATLSDVIPGAFSTSGEGLPLERGGLFDPTLRGGGGFGLDVLADIVATGGISALLKSFTKGGIKAIGKEGAEKIAKESAEEATQQFAAKGVKEVVKDSTKAFLDMAQKVPGELFQAPRRLLSRGGKRYFDSAFDKVQIAGTDVGKNAVAEAFFRHKILGPSSVIRRKTEKASTKLLNEVNDILGQASNKGARVNTVEAISEFENFLVKAQRTGDPTTGRRLTFKQAEKIRKKAEILKFLDGPNPTPKLANQWRRDIDKIFRQRDWVKGIGTDIQTEAFKTLRKGFKDGIEKSVDDALGAGKGTIELASKNRDHGIFLSTKKAIKSLSNEKGVKLSSRDLALLGFGGGVGAALGGPIGGGVGAAAALKGAELVGTTGARTIGGVGLRAIGETAPLAAPLDALTRQLLIQQTGPVTGER